LRILLKSTYMGLYLKKKLDNDAEIGVWQITETEEELKELSSTPTDEMEEISFIRSESLRKQRLAVRALLNTMFDDKVYLSHHDNGKPYIENNPINISITHTAKYVAVILHEEENVGIDIESLDRDFSVVEKKALSEDEIEDLEDEKRNEQLAIYWCAKEAIFKLLSRYNVDFAEQIEVERFRPRGEGELEATFTYKDEEEEFDLEYITFDRHVLVWVVGE
jgi:Phosphopantetheinyl transferase